MVSFIDPRLPNYIGGEPLTKDQVLQNIQRFNKLNHTINVDEAANLIAKNFTLTLLAIDTLELNYKQHLNSPRIGIFSNNITNYGKIDAS